MAKVEKPATWVRYRWPKEVGVTTFSVDQLTFERGSSGDLWLLESQVGQCESALLAAGFEKMGASVEASGSTSKEEKR